MSFDLDRLRRAVSAHGAVARIVVAGHQGSVPRETGTSMLVWDTGQEGTIGGGALEFGAVQAAKQSRIASVQRVSLGPRLGQCCGGAVTLATEWFDSATLPEANNGLILRDLLKTAPQPLSVERVLRQTKAGIEVPLTLADGWLVEPLRPRSAPLWVFGAGHVGRAIAAVLAPLPEWDITLIDTHPERLPDRVPDGVTPLVANVPARLVAHAPRDAHHLILTYSHALDLELCHQVLMHGFQSAGLIGSATKWARFRKRLAQLGHDAPQIDRITCPIGDPVLGKHPQAIAIGVAAALISGQVARTAQRGALADG